MNKITTPGYPDILTNGFDRNTGADVKWIEAVLKPDGAPITDADVDYMLYAKDTSGQYYTRAIEKGIDVEWFRLPTDTDDADVLQRAFDKIVSLKTGLQQISLRLSDNRTYKVNKTLNFYGIGEVDLVGAGIRKSAIVATAAIDSVIKLTDGSPAFQGRYNIENLSISGGGLAACAIDATGIRYSRFEHIEISNLADDAIGIKIDNWVNYLNRIIFLNTTGGTGLTGIKIFQGGSTNDVSITNCSFTSYRIGIHIDDVGNLINIWGNNFDNCGGAGIYLSQGSRGINIDHNYFERCGTTGITVTKGAPGSPTETWKGAIIAHHYYLSAETWIDGLNITNNQFANVTSALDTVITLSGVYAVMIKDNYTYKANKYRCFVEFRWAGISQTSSKKVIIDHNQSQAVQSDFQFTQLVSFNTDNSLLNDCGAVIKERKISGFSRLSSLPILNDPFKWPSSVAWTNYAEDTPYDGVFKVVKVRPGGITSIKSLVLNLDTGNQTQKDTYFRVNFECKGTIGAPAGFVLRYYIDGVLNRTFSSSGENWVAVGRGNIIYVPRNATSIEFQFQGVGSGTLERSLTKFSIIPASYDIEYFPMAIASAISRDISLCGGTPEGYFTARAGQLVRREDGAAGTTYYIKEMGNGNTGWKETMFTDSTVYTKENLQTSGQAVVHWDNIINKGGAINVLTKPDANSEITSPSTASAAFINNTTGSTNYPATQGIGIHVQRSGYSTTNGIGTFQLWTANNAQEDYYIRKLTAVNTWSTWKKLYHEGNLPVREQHVISLADFYTDQGNTSATSGVTNTLYACILSAGRLNAVGEKITALFSGVFAANSNTKGLSVWFNGLLLGSNSVISNGTGWIIRVNIIRTGSDTARSIVEMPGIDPILTDISGLNFANSITLNIDGSGGGAINDVIAKIGSVKWETAV